MNNYKKKTLFECIRTIHNYLNIIFRNGLNISSKTKRVTLTLSIRSRPFLFSLPFVTIFHFSAIIAIIAQINLFNRKGRDSLYFSQRSSFFWFYNGKTVFSSCHLQGISIKSFIINIFVLYLITSNSDESFAEFR